MRQAILLFAATAAGFVTPRAAESQQVPIVHKGAAQGAVQSWWDALPDASDLLSAVEGRITESVHRVDSILRRPFGSDHSEGEEDNDDDDEHFHPPHHGHHPPRGDPDKTIYELIKESKHTTKFAKLIEDYDEIKQLLQDTKHNHTLLVPTDRAFRRIPRHHKGKHGHDGDDNNDDDDDDQKPPKEFVLALLKYHLLPGLHSWRDILSAQTLPTELQPAGLGDSDKHPQRLRVSATPLLHRVTFNFHARLLAGDFVAKNGLVHAVDAFLLPPPGQATLVRLLPGTFSTFALALERTGLVDELEASKGGSDRVGGTLFAPTNHAWAMLGPRANAFLFSEWGRKYLKALVKYHIVVNETLYSDAFYRPDDDGEEDDEGVADYRHVDLPTLLDDKPVSVDIKTWRGFVSIVVNGFVRVVIRDGVANDGVIQVVGKVLIPPRQHDGGGHHVNDEDISVEELKGRLEPYLETESGAYQEGMGDL